MARGPACSSSPTRPSTAASRSPSGTAARTKPISSAFTASNLSPVMNSSRAADSPILRITYGEITAGMIPRRTSVNPNCVPRAATGMSHAATSPAPPPRAAPWMRATTGLGDS